MFKNTGSQSVTLLAIDASTGLQKTGDSANMVFYVSKDDGAVTAISSNSGVPTESDNTNAKGDYKIALSQTETNADKLRFSGKSSTANIVIVPQTIYAIPAAFGIAGGAAGGVFIAGANADTTANITGNITGNLSGSVGSVTGLTAADVGSIKTQTDKLTFTVANQIDANIQYVNDVQVNGVGTVGSPWGP